MREEPPYNPLDKINLGISVANAMLQRPVEPLPPKEMFRGAGIYAIYYVGKFPAYKRIAEANRNDQFRWPIYVGKGIPKGGRKGKGRKVAAGPGRALYDRLRKHAKSIQQVANLDLKDFYCRFLVVDDIWIPLGESLLIQDTGPIWNKVIDGFGNNTPGKRRFDQYRSYWDVIHPGRDWAMKCAENPKSEADLLQSLKAYLASLP